MFQNIQHLALSVGDQKPIIRALPCISSLFTAGGEYARVNEAKGLLPLGLPRPSKQLGASESSQDAPGTHVQQATGPLR